MAGTYTNLLYHLVFSTKNRIPLVTTALRGDLYAYVGEIIRGEKGTLLEIGGMPDHVHLLAKLTPGRSVSEMLNRIQGEVVEMGERRESETAKVWLAGRRASAFQAAFRSATTGAAIG